MANLFMAKNLKELFYNLNSQKVNCLVVDKFDNYAALNKNRYNKMYE